MRAILRTVVWLTIWLSLLAGSLYFFRETVAKAAVMIGGRYVTGVNVSVGSIAVEGGVAALESPGSAILHLKDLELGNPPGFESPKFMVVKEITVGFKADSLNTDTVEIDNVALDGVRLHLERNHLLSNAGVILTRLANLRSEPAPLLEIEKRFQVRRLQLHDVTARIAYAPALGARGQAYVEVGGRELSAANAHLPTGATALLYHVIDSAVSLALLEVAHTDNAKQKLRARISPAGPAKGP